MDNSTGDSSLFEPYPPMGVYDVLASFQKTTGKYMSSEGTHPWVQGSPLEGPVPGGPEMPTSLSFKYSDLKYPSGVGEPILIEKIVKYYKHFYDAAIEAENVFIFAGGKAALIGCLSFIKHGVNILVEEVEYSQYYDALQRLKKKYCAVACNEGNSYRTCLNDYRTAELSCVGNEFFVLKSNPSNPTGVVYSGERLRELVAYCSQDKHGGLFDEAYEFFHHPPECALSHIPDINQTNIIVLNAATKGLQAPGVRVAWVVASREMVGQLRNYSSVCMGGVSRLSQLYVAELLDINRVNIARRAVNDFYAAQRQRYRDALTSLGCIVFGGDASFYLWMKLPGGLTGEAFNARLFAENAAILPGSLCDILRRGDASPHASFVRFSFGPLRPESFDNDLDILEKCLR